MGLCLPLCPLVQDSVKGIIPLCLEHVFGNQPLRFGDGLSPNDAVEDREHLFLGQPPVLEVLGERTAP